VTQPDARQALEQLRQGNKRFATGRRSSPHADADRLRQVAEHGQHPFATVVTCSDSRVPPELLFDQGVGDLFVIRVAGNICGPSEIASIEFAVTQLHTPLLVVLGHTDCGAVTAATTGAEAHGHIAKLLNHIRPAIRKARSEHPHLTSEDLIPHVIKHNLWQTIEDLFRASPATVELVRARRLEVLGALYDLDTARVDFLGRHPSEQEIVG